MSINPLGVHHQKPDKPQGNPYDTRKAACIYVAITGTVVFIVMCLGMLIELVR